MLKFWQRQNRPIYPQVFILNGNVPGKTLLVTAGMDGDEYAGIAAAYELVKRYESKKFAGRLIIIPIVNVTGFENETSWNPADKKYPKFIVRGNAKGTASEQLIHWLNQTYAREAQVWIDLHGGNLTEQLQPFAWFHETKNIPLNQLAQAAISKLDGIVVYEKPTPYRGQELAKYNCLYVLTESGQQGTVQKADVDRHIHWVEVLMQTVGMIEAEKGAVKSKATVYKSVHIIYTPASGIWHAAAISRTLKTDEVIGEIETYNGRKRQQIKASVSGVVLWKKVGMRVGKGDMLLAVAA